MATEAAQGIPVYMFTRTDHALIIDSLRTHATMLCARADYLDDLVHDMGNELGTGLRVLHEWLTEEARDLRNSEGQAQRLITIMEDANYHE